MLHLVAPPLAHLDLLRGHSNELILQHPEGPPLRQQGVDRSQAPHALELQKVLHLPELRVHEHVKELAVLRPHLLWVEDLVPPADLKHVLEELRIVAELLALDELLPLFVVLRHNQAAQDGAHVPELLVYPVVLAPVRYHIHPIRVLADVKGGFQKPQKPAVRQAQPQRDILGPLLVVIRGGGLCVPHDQGLVFRPVLVRTCSLLGFDEGLPLPSALHRLRLLKVRALLPVEGGGLHLVLLDHAEELGALGIRRAPQHGVPLGLHLRRVPGLLRGVLNQLGLRHVEPLLLVLGLHLRLHTQLLLLVEGFGDQGHLRLALPQDHLPGLPLLALALVGLVEHGSQGLLRGRALYLRGAKDGGRGEAS